MLPLIDHLKVFHLFDFSSVVINLAISYVLSYLNYIFRNTNTLSIKYEIKLWFYLCLYSNNLNFSSIGFLSNSPYIIYSASLSGISYLIYLIININIYYGAYFYDEN